MRREICLGIALACAALSLPGSARQEPAAEPARELVAAIRALARERAQGGSLELRASCADGGEGAVHVVIEVAGARTELFDEPPLAQQMDEPPQPAPATSSRPPSARRALEAALAGVAALGEEAQQVRVRSVSSDAREAPQEVRVKLDLELLAPSQEQALALYERLRDEWRAADGLRELGRAPVRPLERESGVAVPGLQLTYAWAPEPLEARAEAPGSLELFVRRAAGVRGSDIGDLALFPREHRTRSDVVDEVLLVEPAAERVYPLDAVRRFLGSLENGAHGVAVTGADLERAEGDRWRFRAEVTRRSRAD